MPFLDHVLQVPTYGWKDSDGSLVKPNKKQLLNEFFKRLNIFKDRRNWLPFFSWLKVACLIPFFVLFLVYHLSWWTVAAAFMVHVNKFFMEIYKDTTPFLVSQSQHEQLMEAIKDKDIQQAVAVANQIIQHK